MNKTILIVVSLIVLGAIGFAITSKRNVSNSLNQGNTPRTSNPSQNQITPQPSSSTFLENPIKNTSTIEGFKISNALVENNVDPKTQKPVNDHLEFTLTNTSDKDLINFEVYYTVIDTITFKKEAYYLPLTGLILKKTETINVNFDNGAGDGHFPSQGSNLYKNSQNKLLFNILVSSPGYKVESTETNKAIGTGEKSD